MINDKTVELSLPNVVGYERIAMGCSETFAKNLGFKRERIEDEYDLNSVGASELKNVPEPVVVFSL